MPRGGGGPPPPGQRQCQVFYDANFACPKSFSLTVYPLYQVDESYTVMLTTHTCLSFFVLITNCNAAGPLVDSEQPHSTYLVCEKGFVGAAAAEKATTKTHHLKPQQFSEPDDETGARVIPPLFSHCCFDGGRFFFGKIADQKVDKVGRLLRQKKVVVVVET